MKATAGKSPEKKSSSSESVAEQQQVPPTTDGQDRRAIKCFGWMRVFSFSNLLVRQGC